MAKASAYVNAWVESWDAVSDTIHWESRIDFGDWAMYGVWLDTYVYGTLVNTTSGYVTSSYESCCVASGSFVVSKTHSEKDVRVRAVGGGLTVNGYGGTGEDYDVSVYVYTGPKYSYTVSYNANGGTGAPASQTKWHGETLTLSSTYPDRSGYWFQGWATSSNGSVVYNSSGSYTSNNSATLYAVWKIRYIAPTVSDLIAIRTTNSGIASNDGTYIKVTGSWAVDTTNTPTNKATNLKIEYRAYTSSTWTQSSSVNPNAASGTISSIIGGGNISIGSAYYVRVTVTDSGGNIVQQKLVPAQARPIDIGNFGKTIAIGAPASDTDGFEVAMASRFTNSITTDSLYFNIGGTANQVNDFVVAQGTSGNWFYIKWNSGKAECWGTFANQTATTNQQYGTQYYTASPLIYTFPFTFAVAPSSFASATSLTTMALDIGTLTTTRVGFYPVRGNNLTYTFVATVMAKGRWK